MRRPSKDPRFDATIGGKAFDRDAFAHRYSFLFDDVLPAERARLKAALKKERRDDQRREIQSQLTRLQQQLSNERSRRRATKLEHDWKVRRACAHAEHGSALHSSADVQAQQQLLLHDSFSRTNDFRNFLPPNHTLFAGGREGSRCCWQGTVLHVQGREAQAPAGRTV